MADERLNGSVEIRRLSVSDRTGRPILTDIDATFEKHRITCVLGPSGVGKTTLLRCINRLIDLTPDLRVSGEVRVCGENVRGRGVDVDDLRRRVGIVFQQPVTFPGSIAKNVVFAAKRLGIVPRHDGAGTIEDCLRAAHLWNEVHDRLQADASELSVGQQQRLAVARTLAGQPEILLMDEPTSALDAVSTERIENTILSCRGKRTVILVTHDEAQASRLADAILRMA